MSGGRTVALGDQEYLVGELPVAERDWIIERLGPLFIAAAEAVPPPDPDAEDAQAVEWASVVMPAILSQLAESDVRRILQACTGVCRVRCGEEWIPLSAASSAEDLIDQLFLVFETISTSVAALSSQLLAFAARGHQAVGRA